MIKISNRFFLCTIFTLKTRTRARSHARTHSRTRARTKKRGKKIIYFFEKKTNDEGIKFGQGQRVLFYPRRNKNTESRIYKYHQSERTNEPTRQRGNQAGRQVCR